MRILISWPATENDFLQNNEVNTKGPTFDLHQSHFYNNYDRHILVFTPDTKRKITALTQSLKNTFGNREIVHAEIDIDPYADMVDIKSALSPTLLELKEHQLSFFISPGSSTMKLAWLLCHLELKLNSQLVQLIKKEDTRLGVSSELQVLDKVQNNTGAELLRKEIDFQTKKGIHDLAVLQPIYRKALQLAQVEHIPVLILGESGTGKELLAQYIHANSSRRKNNFEPFNSSAFTDEILESRLFGHVAGSFTGAVREQKGIFEKATKGTVFLDEIGDISPKMQQNLLRVIEYKEISPIGGNTKKVNTRVILATHRDLTAKVAEGSFRKDLFFRINISPLVLPPLAIYPRKDFLKLLNFLNVKQQEVFKRKLKLKFGKQALEQLYNYHFPGNIRELENIIIRLYLHEPKPQIDQIPNQYFISQISNHNSLEWVKRQHINHILKLCDGNKTQAAKILGISSPALYDQLKK